MEQSSPESAGRQRCGACGAGFECGIQVGRSTCWCFELPRVCRVDPDANCWCPECLAAEVARQQSGELLGCHETSPRL